VVALAVFAAGVGWSVSSVPAGAAAAVKPYDFDGDGHPDLVVGAPGMAIHDMAWAGGVVVLPASGSGLSLHARLISQSSRGVPGASEEADFFGSSLASADFDGDSYADLAVGASGESVGGHDGAGSVTVVYGSARGLDTSRSAWIGQPGGSVSDANWGGSLVASDFNRDGYADLAVSAPGTPWEDSPDGTVRVLSGSAGGLLSTGVPVLGSEGGSFDARPLYGYRLAAGDVDGDGFTDLVVGAHGENQQHEPDSEPVYGPWSVSYCPGKVGGPTSCRRLATGQDASGLEDLAVGNMSGNPRPEIVVGLPQLGYGRADAGRVQILQLTAGPSVTVTHRTTITQNSPGVPGANESEDWFGRSIALGDLDRDGYAELVVGAPGENSWRGRVTVVHGASTGWRTSGNCAFSQNTRGVPGVAEELDSFGSAVTLLDHNGDRHLDLTVSASGENSDAGAVTTLRGSSGCGFTTRGSRTFGLATLGYHHQFNEGFGDDLGRP